MATGKRVFVSVSNDLFTDQRVNKICLFLNGKGNDVTLVGRRRKDSPELPKRAYKTKRMTLIAENGPLFYASLNFRLFLFLLFKKADILVANDLDTLLANYLASRLKRNCKLVYDTHELYTEVPELLGRPRVRRFWLRIERTIFPKLKNIYTVNRSIADIYEDKYKVPVQVVRNISPKWHPNEILSKKELGIPENTPLIILQGAGINIHRGAEEAVEAMQNIPAVLLIVGDGDVVPQLKQRVKEVGLNEKVIFYGKKPYDLLLNYTYHADIGLTLDRATNLNYKYSLPNKIFDYINTGTAIVATNLPEVRRVVEENKVGVIIGELTPLALSATINSLIKNKTLLDSLKKNCHKAAETENWETERLTLEKIYSNVR